MDRRTKNSLSILQVFIIEIANFRLEVFSIPPSPASALSSNRRCHTTGGRNGHAALAHLINYALPLADSHSWPELTEDMCCMCSWLASQIIKDTGAPPFWYIMTSKGWHWAGPLRKHAHAPWSNISSQLCCSVIYKLPSSWKGLPQKMPPFPLKKKQETRKIKKATYIVPRSSPTSLW